MKRSPKSKGTSFTRNAVMRVDEEAVTGENGIIGLYAENLVFNALDKWRGKIDVTYYREKDSEIDFIMHLAAGKYLPIEVKYRNKVPTGELKTIGHFSKKKGTFGLVITKLWKDVGWVENFFMIPLPQFLVLFD
ncbi:MAG: DUF4143 domain-containing protein [Nitrospinae bacterium]|nr:DUF4143 domain-containing protein [Nitrospinota bacterium]